MASKQFDQLKQHNTRLSDMIKEPTRMLPPIKGFENLDLVSLEKAVESLISIVPEIDQMIYVVTQNCTNPKDDLTPDESASIMLYSMEWTSRDDSFYFILNKTLRSENRQLLKPWFLYLRLFIHSLSKLPSIAGKAIFRGIKMDLRNDYPTDKEFVWWAFSSCTNQVSVLENEEFFGKTGKRTLFVIECDSGKDIHNHSLFPTENEILLIAARQFRVIANLNSDNDLYIIQIKEIKPPFPFISCSPMIPSTMAYQNRKLEDRIKICPMDSEINLNQQNLTDQDMNIVVQEAIINKRCKKLSLENNIITSQGAITIANGLNNNTTLEALILYHNHLSDLGVRHLSKVLSTNSSNLKILGIGSNSITDNGIQYLAQMLKKNQSLIVLGLVFNEITDQGVRLLADALSHDNQTLQFLHLSKNKSISNSSFEYLNQMLKRNHSLRELWMQNCSLSNDIKQNLRQSIRSKTNFRLEL
ncbi:unnamed protein product [Rotaria sp. Silwood2]|nr:unnamed protein product [Rotaria sp. Silwood2]CAF3178223.1 unnamed protein product [Rotaria sp. Silwood2]CAF3923995.1 unnamed protein product [Rotaria sp. Silwood2]CAF3962342.1 unnamed protein product [Rotaria sp. Silwood2]